MDEENKSEEAAPGQKFLNSLNVITQRLETLNSQLTREKLDIPTTIVQEFDYQTSLKIAKAALKINIGGHVVALNITNRLTTAINFLSPVTSMAADFEKARSIAESRLIDRLNSLIRSGIESLDRRTPRKKPYHARLLCRAAITALWNEAKPVKNPLLKDSLLFSARQVLELGSSMSDELGAERIDPRLILQLKSSLSNPLCPRDKLEEQLTAFVEFPVSHQNMAQSN